MQFFALPDFSELAKIIHAIDLVLGMLDFMDVRLSYCNIEASSLRRPHGRICFASSLTCCLLAAFATMMVITGSSNCWVSYTTMTFNCGYLRTPIGGFNIGDDLS
jgi:hypothetical protein